jgi:hypothetical protein
MSREGYPHPGRRDPAWHQPADRSGQPAGTWPLDETGRVSGEQLHQQADWPPDGHIYRQAHADLPDLTGVPDDLPDIHEDDHRDRHPRRQPACRQRNRRGKVTAPAVLLIAGLAAIILGAVSASGPIQITPANNPIQEGSPYPLGVSGGSSSALGASSPAATPSASASPSPAVELKPALTLAQARQYVASYWQRNSQANAQLSDALLSEVETGSSYSLDAGIFKMDQTADPPVRTRLAFQVSSPVYYIPREAANPYPHWFAVRFSYTPAASPPGTGYLVFTQTAASDTWKVALEPYVLRDSGPPPFIPADSQGYATAAATDGTTGPGQIASQTAASLNGTSSAVTIPGTLSDLYDEGIAAKQLPAGSTISDTHSADGPVSGLQTVGGGVLTFFGLTAQLKLAAPTGQTFSLAKPGFYMPDQPLTSASIRYTDQFAVYLPAGQDSVPQVIADASGIAG